MQSSTAPTASPCRPVTSDSRIYEMWAGQVFVAVLLGDIEPTLTYSLPEIRVSLMGTYGTSCKKDFFKGLILILSQFRERIMIGRDGVLHKAHSQRYPSPGIAIPESNHVYRAKVSRSSKVSQYVLYSSIYTLVYL